MKVKIVELYHTINWTPTDMLRYDTMFAQLEAIRAGIADQYKRMPECDVLKPVLFGFDGRPTLERWHSFGAGLEKRGIFTTSRLFEQQDQWATIVHEHSYHDKKSPYTEHELEVHLKSAGTWIMTFHQYVDMMGVKQ